MEHYPTALKNIIQIQESSYKDMLSNISAKQKPVLFAIAKEGEAINMTSIKFLKENNLGSSSSVQAALKGLLEKDIITRTEKGYRVYDYFFAEWLRQNYWNQVFMELFHENYYLCTHTNHQININNPSKGNTTDRI